MIQTLLYLFVILFTLNERVSCASFVWNKNLLKTCECKIVGGTSVTIEDVPYQVYLTTTSGRGICGGSIINSKTVLTAAHCVASKPSAIIVRAGSANNHEGGKTYEGKDIRMHPKYSENDIDYDVAVIKLSEPMKLDGVTTRPVKLVASGADTAPGLQLLVSGWGSTTEGGQSSNKLLAVKVPVVSQSDCGKSYPPPQLTPRMICAGVKGKDSCQGDSGGPAVSVETGEQVGIVSWGKGCARPGYPGVYTRVGHPSVREFIDKNSE